MKTIFLAKQTSVIGVMVLAIFTVMMKDSTKKSPMMSYKSPKFLPNSKP